MKEVPIKYDIDQCTHIWKCIQTKGFKSEEHKQEYKNFVIPNYRQLTGKELPSFSNGNPKKE